MKKTNLLAVLALAATPAFLHAQTVSTPIVGFEKRNFVSGTTGHGVGFVLSSKFQGAASSVTPNSLSVSSPSFTASQFALSGGLPTHYIQITSGAQSGLVVDIIGNTTSSLTVASGDLASVSGGTPNFVIRPHILASTLFKGNASLADDSDTLTLFNSDGSTTTLAWSSASSTGWIDPNSLAPIDAVIYPGQGFLLNTSGSGDFTANGVVNPASTIVPLYAGKVNLVSLSNPSSGKDLQNINLGANLEAENDTIGTFSSDGYLSQDSAYTWNGPAGGGFVDPNSLVPASGVNVGGTSVIIVNSTFDTSWNQPSPLTP